jgi:hypothetical protein
MRRKINYIEPETAIDKRFADDVKIVIILEFHIFKLLSKDMSHNTHTKINLLNTKTIM